MDPQTIAALLGGTRAGQAPSTFPGQPPPLDPAQLFGLNGGLNQPNSLAVSPLAGQPAQAQTPQPAAASPSQASAVSQVMPMRPADKFVGTLSDGTKITGANAAEHLSTLLQNASANPNAPEIAKLEIEGKKAKDLASWITGNAAPQQAHIEGGPMPSLAATPTPVMHQAHLNPLAVMLGLATGMGGNYGNPGGAVASQIGEAINQTHQNFQNDMASADFASNQAAQQYHDAMEARDAKLREAATNGEIDFANAKQAYQDRKGAAGLTIDSNADTGPDSLSQRLTAIGQTAQDIQTAGGVQAQVAGEPQRYQKDLSEAAKTDYQMAQTATDVATRQSKIDKAEGEAAGSAASARKQTADAAKSEQEVRFGKDLHQINIQNGLAKLDTERQRAQELRSMIGLHGAQAGEANARAGSAKAQTVKTQRETQMLGQITPAQLPAYMNANNGYYAGLGKLRDAASAQLQTATDKLNILRNKAATPGTSTDSPYTKAAFSSALQQQRLAQDNYDSVNQRFVNESADHDTTDAFLRSKAQSFGLNLAGGGGVHPGGGLPTITTQAQLRALPSGSHFVTADGAEHTKN